ncbi:MAG: hypothetical protein KF799_10000 [Bdellovibrionales bacterium]|nr:hypothetical protein [Bdellovibrionales bacterium]
MSSIKKCGTMMIAGTVLSVASNPIKQPGIECNDLAPNAVYVWGSKHEEPCDQPLDIDPSSGLQGIANMISASSGSSSSATVIVGPRSYKINVASPDSIPEYIDYDVLVAALKARAQQS